MEESESRDIEDYRANKIAYVDVDSYVDIEDDEGSSSFHQNVAEADSGEESIPLNSVKENKRNGKLSMYYTKNCKKGNRKSKQNDKCNLNVRANISSADVQNDQQFKLKHNSRYRLRCRKKAVKNDDFQYFDSDSDEEDIKFKRTRSENKILECVKCGRIFDDKRSLNVHIKRNIYCKLCNKSFCSIELLEDHKNTTCKRRQKVNLKSIVNHCKKCGEIFDSVLELEKHIPSHNEYSKVETNSVSLKHLRKKQSNQVSRGVFTCDICKKGFSYLLTLKQHIRQHMKNPFSCQMCKKKFKTEPLLQNHNCKVSNSVNVKTNAARNTPSVCHICNGVFPQFGKLQIHLLRHQGISYKCGKCNKSFTSQNLLTEHESNVDCLKKVKKCDKCGKVYRDNFNFKKHMKSHKDDVMKCSNCKKVFIDDTKFHEHLQASNCDKPKLSNEKLRYECDACGQKFLRIVKLQIHILNIHQGINYQCGNCSVKFASEEDLEQHTSSKTCKSEEPCYCKVCGKSFSKRDYLKKHEYMHTNALYKCKYCYCVFIKKSSFEKHMTKMNCSKNARKIKLSEFNCKTCRLCNSEFDTEDSLLQHFETSHPGVNPHQCFCCVEQLPTYQDLERHIHQHNIQKYTCNLCGKPYTSQEGFRRHRLKHKGAEFQCKFCKAEFLKENRYKFHIRSCKKNPESGYDPLKENSKPKKKDNRPKQSRQLNWESRIIQKRLRPCPTFSSAPFEMVFPDKNTGNITSQPHAFFEDIESDSESTSKKGWFDEYYKIEEDDYGTIEKKEKEVKEKDNANSSQNYESDFDVSEFLKSKSLFNKRRNEVGSEETKTVFLQDDSFDGGNENDDYDDDINDADYEYEANIEKEIESSSKMNSTNSEQLKKEKTITKTSEGDSSSSEEDCISDEDPVQFDSKKCRLCKIDYSHEYELLHHFIKNHPGEQAHKCPDCSHTCPLYAQLKEHMKTHGIGMGVYNCDNCSKRFKNERKMKKHNIKCKGLETEMLDGSTGGQANIDNEDYCKKCLKKFQTKCGYRRHKQICKARKKKQDKDSKVMEENLVKSNEKMSNEKNLKMLNEPEKDELEDEEDDVDNDAIINDFGGGIDSPDESIQSSLENVKDLPKPVQHDQEKCEKLTKNVKDVKVKESSDVEEKDKSVSKVHCEPPLDSFPCRLCDKKFQYERGIVMHFKNEHPGHKPLICPVCNMHLADKLKEHLKTHGIGEEFICELCGKRFNQKFLSKIHEMWHQGIEYKCNNCKQKFLNKEKMEKHIAENKCKDRQSLIRLPCEICGKSYKSRFGLNKHFITHTPKELRPVKNRMNCEFCGKWFENHNGLIRHRRIHTGERPYCCRYCPKAFAQEGNCKAHERTHTGESRPRKRRIVNVYVSYQQPSSFYVSQILPGTVNGESNVH